MSPSQRSKMTVSLLASSTIADTTSPSISSSITSPARSFIVVVFIVPVLSQVCPCPTSTSRFVPWFVPLHMSHRHRPRSALRELSARRLGEHVGQAVADLVDEHRAALLEETLDPLAGVCAASPFEDGPRVDPVSLHRMIRRQHRPHHPSGQSDADR